MRERHKQCYRKKKISNVKVEYMKKIEIKT